MLQNNNKECINKISKKILKTNKMRNIFAILAIALTTLLITTTLTAGITFYKANKAYMNVSNYGVDSDGYISINDGKLKKLKRIDNIEKIGISKLASLEGIKNKELLNEHVSVQSVDKNAYKMMSIIPIEGTYPKSEDEVLMPTWVLDLLEVDKKIGENILLDIEVEGKIKTLNLKLSGYYESLAVRGSGNTNVFVSESFIKKHNKGISKNEESQTAFFTLSNINEKSTFNEVKKEIEKIGKEIGSKNFSVHPKYEEDLKLSNKDDIKQFIAISTGIVLVVFTGYLIIYNIFYISVSKDIRFYGLLKAIGTTSKQLKKIILRQALKLSIIGIPIGLALGYIVSDFITPLALKLTIFNNIAVVSKSIYIYIVSILFSLITVYISCTKPGNLASKVSPVEAVRFVVSDAKTSKKKTKKGIDGAKVYKMAYANLLKSRKRVYVSILSISLSALIIIFTINATLGMNPEKHADNQVTSDITINNNISHFFGEEEYNPISKDLIKEVKSLDIVKEATPYYSVITYEEDGNIYDFGAKIKLNEEFKENIKGDEDIIDADVKALRSDKLEKEIKRVKVVDGNINKEEFKKGNQIIYYAPNGEVNGLKAGDNISITFIMRDKYGKINEINKEFKVMAIVADNSRGWTSSNFGLINLDEEAFKNIFKDYKNYISSIDIELKDDIDIKEADKIINDLLVKSDNYMLGMSSKNFYIEGIKEMKTILMTIGTVLGSILGIIGTINILNTILSSIFNRKVEFAMLESIGMTKKQIKKMLLFEGLYYILLTIILVVPLGVVVAFIAPMVVPIYGGFNLSIYALSVIICMIVISILMLTIPFLGYKIVSKESILERIRATE